MSWSTELAHEVARTAHEGTFDKAGNPYIRHPERVADIAAALLAESFARFGLDAGHVRAVALLHDVVEDTTTTLEDLRALGAPSEVLSALALLTHAPGEEYGGYVRRLAQDPLARVVKLADNLDNADESRLALLPPATADRLRAKYARVRPLLEP